MAESSPRDSEEATALDDAKEWFVTMLDGLGWVSSLKIDASLKENHIAVATFPASEIRTQGKR